MQDRVEIERLMQEIEKLYQRIEYLKGLLRKLVQ